MNTIDLTLDTGETKKFVIPDGMQIEDLETVFRPVGADADYRRWIDNLDISADAKAALLALASASVRVGKTVLWLGKRALDLCIALVRKLPNASIGAIVAAGLMTLVSSIPLVGGLIPAFVIGVVVALGFAVGAVKDLLNTATQAHIDAAVSSLFKNISGVKPA